MSIIPAGNPIALSLIIPLQRLHNPQGVSLDGKGVQTNKLFESARAILVLHIKVSNRSK